MLYWPFILVTSFLCGTQQFYTHTYIFNNLPLKFESITTSLQSPSNRTFINLMGCLQNHLCAMRACPHHAPFPLLQKPSFVPHPHIAHHHQLWYHLRGKISIWRSLLVRPKYSIFWHYSTQKFKPMSLDSHMYTQQWFKYLIIKYLIKLLLCLSCTKQA